MRFSAIDHSAGSGRQASCSPVNPSHKAVASVFTADNWLPKLLQSTGIKTGQKPGNEICARDPWGRLQHTLSVADQVSRIRGPVTRPVPVFGGAVELLFAILLSD